MRVTVVDSHTAGEPTRLITGGIPDPDGSTLAAQQESLFQRWPGIIEAIAGEPRGSAPMHCVVPVPATDPGADVAFLIFSALGRLTMCGHALIGAVTTMLETGALPVTGPTTIIRVETLAGIVEAEARAAPSGRVEHVAFRNAPSWLLAADLRLRVPEVGDVLLDLAYGGLWYAIVDARSLGLTIDLTHLHRLLRASVLIRRELNRVLDDLRVDNTWPTLVPQVLFTEDGDGATGTNLATSDELGFDRSPCGTGSSARMAALHARGLLGVGDSYLHRSIIGTTFTGTVVGEAQLGERRAIVPEIRGSASITSHATLIFSGGDPLAAGVLIPPVDLT